MASYCRCITPGDCSACRPDDCEVCGKWDGCDCEECDQCGCDARNCGCEVDPEDIEDPEDAEVETFSRFTVHVARQEHSGGRIKPGDTYRRTVYGGYIGPCRDYPEGGPRWLRVVKTLVKRAEEAA